MGIEKPTKNLNIKIAYMMSRFPKITETFILYEMVSLEEQGASISVYPLMREKTAVMHAEAVPYVERAHFTGMFSFAFLSSHFYYLVRKPKTYFRTMFDLFRFNWGSPRFLFGSLAYFPKIVHMARKMDEEGIQYIHAHFASFPAMAAYVIHQLTGIPYSFTAHGSDLHRDQHMLCQKIKDSAFTVTISDYNREFIRNYCGESVTDKVFVNHCGVDIDRFQNQAAEEVSSQSEDVFQILCVGTLHEVKGQRYLIDACQILKSKGINFRCHFIGDGEDRNLLEEMVREKGLEEQVTFHGKLQQSSVIAYMRMADVLVQPSVPTANGRREGIPVVLMEGMSCGVPVVSSKLSGIPELVADGVSGILTEPGNVNAIADAIQFFIENPAAQHQFGEQGIEKISMDFNLVKNSMALLDRITLEVEA